MNTAISSRFVLPTIMLTLLVTGCTFSEKTTAQYLERANQKVYDAIVVPGVPFEDGQWSKIMKARVYWSKYLYDKGVAKNIIYSGSAVYTPYIEAKIMALYAEALGIPQENIFIEASAEHSTENIYYGYKKANKLGFTSIALASDPFQTRMLKRYTRKVVSPDVGLIPIVFDTLRKMEEVMIDPHIDYAKAYVENFESIEERESFWKRFAGTRGKNVKYHYYD